MDLCNDYHFLEGLRIIIFIIKVLRIIIPILLIGFGSYDYFQTVMNPDKNPLQEKTKAFAFRIGSAILIFLLPSIITIVFSNLIEFSDQLQSINDCFSKADSEYIKILKEASKERQRLLQEQDTYYKGNYDSSKYSLANYGELLQVAADLWKKVANGNYTYDGQNNKPIPITGTTIDCSSYISWILYEFGFEDFKGPQYSTVTFMNTNFEEKYGWEEITVAAGEDVTSKLKPGDILVRDRGGGGPGGHINITVDVKDGKVMAFDCGSQSTWKNSGGNSVDKTSFAKDSRPGKIIRVTTRPNGSSNGNSSKTASNSKGDGSILLIAGHTYPPYCSNFDKECRGKLSSGYDETDQTRILVKLIKSELESLNVKADIANVLFTGDNDKMNKSFYTELLSQSAEFKKYDWTKYNYGLEIHFNASETHNASGSNILLPSGASENKADQPILNALKQITGNSGKSYTQDTKVANYFKSIGVPFTYLETEFYDNKTAMDNYYNKKEQIAKEIASIIKENYG